MAASRGPVPPHRLFPTFATLLCILLPLYPAAVSAQSSLLIDCYRFDGVVSPNNTRCPNSNACCGPRATCLSNRLCANPGDGPNLWVRGPCAVKGWDDSCAQVCLYNETRGGIFPRVVSCADGSLCCDEDPQCCQDGRGVFLDESGNRASARATAATTSYPPVSDGLGRFTLTPSTSVVSTTTAGFTSSTSSLSISSTPSRPDSAATSSTSPVVGAPSGSDDSIALKVGLGLGIPLAVLLTACLVYCLRRWWRGTTRTDDADPVGYQPGAAEGHADYRPEGYYSPGVYTPRMEYPVVPKPPPVYSVQRPAELGGSTASELPADARALEYREKYALSPQTSQGPESPRFK
ncbi:hypothetical protein VTK56DRAFT_10133 [Thermocarpiscus australiensis]